ncbi:MAG: hypothetical protein ACXABY_31660, partial [Candidatus Thorarchaeota archaeon]
DNEKLKCTLRSTDTLTVERGTDGTAAASHSDGAVVELRFIVKLIDDITAMFTSGKILTWESEVVVHDGDVVYT